MKLISSHYFTRMYFVNVCTFPDAGSAGRRIIGIN